MKRYALVVGIDEYADRSIRKLNCAQADAVQMATALRVFCGFEKTPTLLGKNASSGNIIDRIEWMGSKLGASDLFLFFFSGHGIEHETYGHLLLLHGARRKALEHLRNETMAVRDLKVYLKSLPSRKAVFILDACRGVDVTRGMDTPMGRIAVRDVTLLAKNDSGRDCRVISSCSPEESALELEELGNGIFTWAFTKVLEERHGSGRGIALDGNLIEEVRSRMREILEEYDDHPHCQRPYMEGGTESLVLLPGKEKRRRGPQGESPRAEARKRGRPAEQKPLGEGKGGRTTARERQKAAAKGRERKSPAREETDNDDRPQRFAKDSSGIITDTQTGLEWYVKDDRDTSWNEAKNWVDSLSVGGGGWRMPTLKELRSLCQEGPADVHLDPIFKNTGWWVWSGRTKEPASAWAFNFFKGKGSGRLPMPRNYASTCRAFAVRSQG